MADTETDKRDMLIKAILPHVAFDGWGEAALRAGAEDCKMSEAEAKALLPQGAVSAIDAFSDFADREMAAALDAMEARPTRITAIVREAILCRLDWAEPHREAVKASLKLLARPEHSLIASKMLYRTVDRIWRLTGDRSVDFSFYTKRASLAGVYSAVLLYWLARPLAGRGGAGREGVEAFLDARLKDITLIPKATAPIRKLAQAGFALASSALSRWHRSSQG